MITLRSSLLRKLAFLYLALPVLIFIGGYLRWTIALPVMACLIFALICACKTASSLHQEKTLPLSVWWMAAMALIMLLWTYLGGLNGLFYQSADWPWRNAIFHDLVEKPWPVVYDEKGSALVYYIGFWMPAALAGKIVGALTNSVVLAWRIARMALWTWTSLGMLLIALLLMVHIQANGFKKQLIALLVLIFFSGMDILGASYADRMERVLDPEILHLEWWTIDGKQYSSITTCLYWVFNQSVIPWLAVLCFLMEKDARNYLFLGIACLCCGPLPFVGLVICMLIRFAEDLARNIRRKQISDSIKAAFSLPNILLLAALLPVFGVFFLSNLSVTRTTAGDLPLFESIREYFTRDFLMFFLLDAGIYLALVWKENRKDWLFYGISLSLFLIPNFHIGASEDFCMRASIPGMFILLTYCARRMISLADFRRPAFPGRLRAALLVCCLLIGAATPAVEIYRGIYHVVQEKTIRLAQDPFGTIEILEEANNFTASDYQETIFFKYLAKPSVPKNEQNNNHTGKD